MEGFVPIPLFDGYLINDKGDIFSTRRPVMVRVHAHKNPHGYYKVNLVYNKSGCRMTVGRYRLLALAFLGVPDDLKMQVNHKNGIKTDDRIENLEWVTPKENTIHAIKTGLYVYKNGVNGKPARPLTQLKDGVVIAEYNSLMEAQRRTGFSYLNILFCANGKYKHAYGFQWLFKDAA